MSETAREAVLHRARSYPYLAPPDSYCWRDGAVEPFDPADRDGRTPVLAYGSNRTPERLAQKFASLGTHTIPVERAVLRDFDVVYSAHITSYGAIPAMLQHCPGATVEVAVTWLDDAQLPIMHDSEMAAANYVYARLETVSLQLGSGGGLSSVQCYVGRHGHFVGSHGGAVPLLALTGSRRLGTPMATGEVLEEIRERVAPKADPDEFILRLVADSDYRRAVTKTISENARPFGYPITVLEDRSQ
ncbi:gamma-glutamylcyclotransferase [Rhodospirillaceae bacterium KN72]|uniref:Gamma-glutamylcyclotransferase n=1 Tax=Pacificispira spongiicola TaxID=2729598 RepID=A0A7Y0DX51_9PROT|nr:gamma-glutamylcyclotransferase [Pacificispira spongiicola]NMM43228.1 gamma-glutamylcyclotransferase [Pacificispira spongiicola]